MVTARSVELGNISPATWTWAPVDWRNQMLKGAWQRKEEVVSAIVALPGFSQGYAQGTVH